MGRCICRHSHSPRLRPADPEPADAPAATATPQALLPLLPPLADPAVAAAVAGAGMERVVEAEGEEEDGVSVVGAARPRRATTT